MKTSKSKLLLLTGILGACALMVESPPLEAQPFNCTNLMISAQTCISYPTNVLNSAGNGVLTGGALSIAAFDRAGFWASGYSTNTGTGNVIFQLVVAASDVLPNIGGQGTGTFTNSGTIYWWNTNMIGSYQISVPINGQGPWYYSTNLPPEWIRPNNWIGLWSVTNSMAASQGQTNLAAGINTKILPMHLQ